MSVHFLCFLFKWKGVNVCLIKYVENEIFNSTSHKKKGDKEGNKNIIQLQKHW